MVRLIVSAAHCDVYKTELLTSGRVGLRVKAEFCSDWNGLTKTAVCSAGNITKDVVIVGDEFVVPHECMTVSGNDLVIGIYGSGSDGSVVIPTVYANIGKIQKGADPSGDPSTEPTPTVYEQILQTVGSLDNLETENKSSIVDAVNEIAENGNRKYKSKYSVRKIQDYLYHIEYDYVDDEAATDFFMNRYSPSAVACSSIRKGRLYGRNYDWYYDNKASFIVSRNAVGGKFASIGIADSLIDNDVAASGVYNELYDYLLYATTDGINENGVVCNINILPAVDRKSTTTGTNPGGIDVPMACLVRRILDEAESADDAIYKIQHEYNIIAPNSDTVSTEMHFMIADAENTYVVEFIDNAPVIIDSFLNNKAIMTNFYLTGYNGSRQSLTDHAMGIERYQILSNGYNAVSNEADMKSLMESVYYTKSYSESENPIWYSEFSGVTERFGDLTKYSSPEDYAPIIEYARGLYATRQRDGQTWQTVHSSVYNIEKKTLKVSVQENTAVFTFGVPSAAGGGAAIIEEVDPTVPLWAKQSSKPTYNYNEIVGRPNVVSPFNNHNVIVTANNNGTFIGSFAYVSESHSDMTSGSLSAVPTCGNVKYYVDSVVGNLNSLLGSGVIIDG